MMNLSCAGNIGGDATTRTAGQNTVTSFSLAVSGYDRKAKEKSTTWVRVSVWGKRGDQLAPMLTKGSRVACSGQLEADVYEGKVQLNLTVQDVTLLGGQQAGGDRRGVADGGRMPAAGKAAAPAQEFDDSDVPF